MVRKTEREREKKRRQCDQNMKREVRETEREREKKRSQCEWKHHEHSNLSDLLPDSIRYLEDGMVKETEKEREKKRWCDQNTKEQTSPKQELKQHEQSYHSDLLPDSISPNVPIEKRGEMVLKQEAKQKVRRTRWDQPLESISLHAGNPTISEETATEYVILNFDPKIEEQHEFYLDIRDEVQEECCKIGAVVQNIHFDRKSGWFCFRFDNKRSAAVAKSRFNGRACHGKSITATYLEEERYRKRYGL